MADVGAGAAGAWRSAYRPSPSEFDGLAACTESSFRLAPFVDGELVPEPVMDALTVGDASAGIPLVLGFAEHELNAVPDDFLAAHRP